MSAGFEGSKWLFQRNPVRAMQKFVIMGLEDCISLSYPARLLAILACPAEIPASLAGITAFPPSSNQGKQSLKQSCWIMALLCWIVKVIVRGWMRFFTKFLLVPIQQLSKISSRLNDAWITIHFGVHEYSATLYQKHADETCPLSVLKSISLSLTRRSRS